MFKLKLLVMLMKRTNSPIHFLLLILFIVIVVVACSEEKTANQNQVETLQAALNSDCQALNDHQISGQEPSWNWLDITVGASTEQDVIERFEETESKGPWIDFATGEQQACVYGYTINDEGVRFWLQNDNVVGIEFINYGRSEFQIEELPETVKEAAELYGHPDNVGWTRMDSFARALVWLDKGILIVAHVGHPDSLKNPIIRSFYFNPMTESEFDSSLWSFYLIEIQPPIAGDAIDTAPRDPFDWEELAE